MDEIIRDAFPGRNMEMVDWMNHAEALRSLFILTNGLNGEAGEATEHFKKWVRDGKLDHEAAAIELGDALAYLTWLAHSIGYTLDGIVSRNYLKLTARASERGTLGPKAPR